jgi:hypothetical protein
MFKKLLAVAVVVGMISSALQAAPVHIPTEKAYQDQNGLPFHLECRRYIEKAGVPKEFPIRGGKSTLHHKDNA